MDEHDVDYEGEEEAVAEDQSPAVAASLEGVAKPGAGDSETDDSDDDNNGPQQRSPPV